jgi:hypothetical protein
MKISKERRQLCSDVTNSHKTEARRRRREAFDGYVLLVVMAITLIITVVDFWRGL